MDNQQERSLRDEDNISDKDTDVTRSQNRQAAGAASEGANVSNDADTGANHHHGGSETGSHQEGQYDKDSSKPMVDKGGL